VLDTVADFTQDRAQADDMALNATQVASSSQDAFDQKGNYSGASTPIFKLIGNALAPNRLVTQ